MKIEITYLSKWRGTDYPKPRRLSQLNPPHPLIVSQLLCYYDREAGYKINASPAPAKPFDGNKHRVTHPTPYSRLIQISRLTLGRLILFVY